MRPGTLAERVLTALVLVPLVVVAVLLLPTPKLALVLALVLLLAAWEWSLLAGIRAQGGRLGYLALLAGCLALLWQVPVRPWYLWLLVPAVIWWAGLAACLLRLRAVRGVCGLDPSLIPTGIVVLASPWIAIIELHARAPQGPLLVLALLVLIWIADTAAYFAGRRFGRRKMAPLLSPGKTWAGFWGGLIGPSCAAALLAMGLGLSLAQGLAMVILAAVTASISVVGDLFESLLKRRRGVKDSGGLLPGHGGVLDRIDSLTAAAPVFALGVHLLDFLDLLGASS